MSQQPPIDWDKPQPHTINWAIDETQIDHYNHVNNVEYVTKLEQVAWSHSNALGLNIDEYRQLDRGMAINKHEIHYLAPTRLEDQIICATWIIHCDKKLKLSRHFQFVKQSNNTTVLRAQTDFVCIGLSCGRPRRMPAKFAEIYGNAVIGEE